MDVERIGDGDAIRQYLAERGRAARGRNGANSRSRLRATSAVIAMSPPDAPITRILRPGRAPPVWNTLRVSQSVLNVHRSYRHHRARDRSVDNLFATFPGVNGATSGYYLKKVGNKRVPTLVQLVKKPLAGGIDFNHNSVAYNYRVRR